MITVGATRDTIVLHTGEAIPFRAHEKDIDNPRIEMSPDGTVTLIHPGLKDPKRMLANNLDWVTTQYQEQARMIKDIESRYETLSHGMVLWGRSFPLVKQTGQYDVRIEEDRIHITTPHGRDTFAYLQNQIKSALRVAIQTITDDIAEEIGVTYNQLSIRNQQTKWASCSTSGTLSFNIRCAFLPVSHIRYLVAHELAHFEVPNHSDTFWELVETAVDNPAWYSDELEGFWLLVNRNPVWESILDTW